MRKFGPPFVAMLAMLSVVVGGARADAAPVNDNFEAAKVVSSLPFTETLDTTDATTQDLEPGASVCASSGKSVWYATTPADTTKLTASVYLSQINAVVGVYSGPSLDNLGLVGCDTEVNFTPNAGETYYFQVGDMEFNGQEFVPFGGIVTFELGLYAPQPQCPGCPEFDIYVSPNVLTNANNAGETSIGVDPKTNAAMFLLSTTTARVTWDDTKSPPAAKWENVSSAITNKITFDPILWTDRSTGRTIVAQLVAGSPFVVGAPVGQGIGTSLMAATDDAGATWLPVVPPVNDAWDHESVGGGPYPAPLNAVPRAYPNAVYYCSQAGTLFSYCSRSDDGGLTFGPSVPLGSPLAGCQSIHGHIQVAPDGTVYVPHRFCQTSGSRPSQGFLSSADAGLTWKPTLFTPLSIGHFDPAMAFDAGGRGYFAATSGGKAYVSVSDASGANWSTPVDLGYAYHIRNAEQVMAVAGSDGRAAVAFYGSPNEGDDQSPEYEGVFHIYVSMTYDGGQTWQTQDITPNDPVQRGCIWAGGLSASSCRNLLDFQGMTIDAKGRVLVGFADGCTSSSCVGPAGKPAQSRASRGTIARQTTGKGLLAHYDGSF